MPDKRQHRGPHPEDSALFGEAVLPTLCEAAGEYAWLLDRGYPSQATLKLVGDRHRLVQRQRIALARSTCSRDQLERRQKKQLGAVDMREKNILIDGYNLLTTIEAALGGGVILSARDGCYRDMASMHGTYRKVAETIPALELIGQTLADHEVAHAGWYLDSPVSNSGRLATIIRELAEQQGWDWQVCLVPDPDGVLAQAELPIVSADSGILDRCAAWWNLARVVIEQHVPTARVLKFFSL